MQYDRLAYGTIDFEIINTVNVRFVIYNLSQFLTSLFL